MFNFVFAIKMIRKDRTPTIGEFKYANIISAIQNTSAIYERLKKRLFNSLPQNKMNRNMLL